jgi:hypothetical protein
MHRTAKYQYWLILPRGMEGGQERERSKEEGERYEVKGPLDISSVLLRFYGKE